MRWKRGESASTTYTPANPLKREGKKVDSRLFQGDLFEIRNHHFDVQTIETEAEQSNNKCSFFLFTFVGFLPFRFGFSISLDSGLISLNWFNWVNEANQGYIHLVSIKNAQRKNQQQQHNEQEQEYVEKPASNNTNCIESNWNGESGISQIASNRNKHMLIWAKRNANVNK